jgi:hypothetical protein
MALERTCQDSAMKHVSITFQFHNICEILMLAEALDSARTRNGTHTDLASTHHVHRIIHTAHAA